eukprot:Pompholyxophrys_punicea_v1_NODE_32_length_5086_cov_32.566090.p3 type:complete len:117 gc:universal NODE_32_length_5086_cov_32.566090:3050-3400(+)
MHRLSRWWRGDKRHYWNLLHRGSRICCDFLFYIVLLWVLRLVLGALLGLLCLLCLFFLCCLSVLCLYLGRYLLYPQTLCHRRRFLGDSFCLLLLTSRFQLCCLQHLFFLTVSYYTI